MGRRRSFDDVSKEDKKDSWLKRFSTQKKKKQKSSGPDVVPTETVSAPPSPVYEKHITEEDKKPRLHSARPRTVLITSREREELKQAAHIEITPPPPPIASPLDQVRMNTQNVNWISEREREDSPLVNFLFLFHLSS